MLKFLVGLVIIIIGAIIIIRTYLSWRKHNAGFRESKKASPNSDYVDLGSGRAYIFGAFLFIWGLYYVVSFFN